MTKKKREAQEASHRAELKKAYSKGYSDAGASWTKRALKGFVAQSGAPSEDIDNNSMTLRQRGRMLYMAAPVATGAINTTRTKTVGSGLHLKPTINRAVLGISDEEAERWQRDVQAEWVLWAEEKQNCDSMGMNNFYELQQLAVKSWLMSGDVFALLKREDPTPGNPYTLRIYLIEADRISTPMESRNGYISVAEGKTEDGNKIYDGVEVDKSGKVVAYHICDYYPGQFSLKSTDWHRVLAVGAKTGLPNILHLMEAERPDQHRGVTFLAPVIEILLQERRFTESTLMAAFIQTCMTAWIKTASDPTAFPFNEVGSDGDESEEGVSENENEYEIAPGQINHLAEGEDVVLGNPNIPTVGFEAFVKAINQTVGAGLEIPYDVLMKEFNASYSAAKGALEEAWETFKMRRSWFVNDFCQPIYETWLAEAVATGRIKAPGFFNDPKIRKAWCGARWDGPAQTHLDPVKEANAAEKEVSHGWKTNEQVTREYYGGDWTENMAQIKSENAVITDTFPETEEGGGGNAV